jgi:hypothetical protein
MDAWRDIRLKARACHAAALAAAKGDWRAAALVAAAVALDDLQLDRYEPGKAEAGVFGFLDRPSPIVNVLSGQDPEDEAVVIAHEIGHFKRVGKPGTLRPRSQLRSEELKVRVIEVLGERRTGSFTADCSRRDLFEIARMLPDRSKWKEPTFDNAKAEIKRRFSIGSNKFSVSGFLPHISDAHALLVIKEW